MLDLELVCCSKRHDESFSKLGCMYLAMVAVALG